MSTDFAALLELQAGARAEDVLLVSKHNPELTENVRLEDNDLYQLTGFEGSSGVLTITAEEAVLWVDGRYAGIARRQYAGTPLRLQSLGGERALRDYLDRLLGKDGARPRKSRLWMDPRKWSALEVEELRARYPAAHFGERHFRGARAAFPERRIDVIGPELSGARVEERLRWLSARIRESEVHLFTSQEDIAWMLNLRAWDFPCGRAVQGRALVARGWAAFFSDLEAPEAARLKAALPGWSLVPHEGRWRAALRELLRRSPSLKLVAEHHRRPGAVNHADMSHLKGLLNGQLQPVDRSIAQLGRLHKNEAEIAALRRYGARLTGVMGTAVEFLQDALENDGRITERAFGLEIDRLARAAGARGPTFHPITGSGANSALPHHRWEKGKVIHPGEMVVIDIGYYFDEAAYATDMTRTVLAGRHARPTELQKEIYTAVLKAFLRQFAARFEAGRMKARQLDQLGRSLLAPFKERGFAFLHGTGHGLGILDHELALTISPKSHITLKSGFCYSLEPGLYASADADAPPPDETFGVRLEDIVVLEARDGWLTHSSLAPHPLDERLIESRFLDASARSQLESYLAACPSS